MKNLEIITSAILANCPTATEKECAFLINIAERAFIASTDIYINDEKTNVCFTVPNDFALTISFVIHSLYIESTGDKVHIECRRIDNTLKLEVYFIDLEKDTIFSIDIRGEHK